MFGRRRIVCQSCGMPLGRELRDGGTNADGTRSAEYCRHCFQEGRFTLPDLTLEQMTARVEEKLRAMHFPGFIARRFTSGLPRLKRWQAAAPAGSR